MGFKEFQKQREIENQKIKVEDAMFEAQIKLTDAYARELMRLVDFHYHYQAEDEDMPLIYGLMQSLVVAGFNPSMVDQIFTKAITMLDSLNLVDSDENKISAFCGAVLRIVEA